MELLDLLQIPPLKQVCKVKASQVEGALHKAGGVVLCSALYVYNVFCCF